MEINLHEYVKRELLARGRPQWEGIAKAAGVGTTTVEKIAYGVTANPGVTTIQKLANTLMNAPASAAPQAEWDGTERRQMEAGR